VIDKESALRMAVNVSRDEIIKCTNYVECSALENKGIENIMRLVDKYL
jgi:succinate dehydrogenase/fumarate reductase-like Fe-S protein